MRIIIILLLLTSCVSKESPTPTSTTPKQPMKVRGHFPSTAMGEIKVFTLESKWKNILYDPYMIQPGERLTVVAFGKEDITLTIWKVGDWSKPDSLIMSVTGKNSQTITYYH